MYFQIFKSLGIEHYHLQLLSPAKGVWAALLLPGSAGRAAAHTAAYLKVEGTGGSKTGREGKYRKRKELRYPRGEMGYK